MAVTLASLYPREDSLASGSTGYTEVALMDWLLPGPAPLWAKGQPKAAACGCPRWEIGQFGKEVTQKLQRNSPTSVKAAFHRTFAPEPARAGMEKWETLPGGPAGVAPSAAGY